MPQLVHSSRFTVHRKITSVNCQLSTVNCKSGGFTLIELLVVIAMLAILGSVIFFSTDNARVKGRDSTRKSDLKNINAAIISYKTDKGHWPPGESSSDYVFSSDIGGTWIPDLEGYLDELPNDPTKPTGDGECDNFEADKYPYCYQLSTDKKSYTLWAHLENEKDSEIYTGTTSACNSTNIPIGVRPNDSLNYCLAQGTGPFD